ncbi:MAG: FAD-binding oxidoreductase [Thermoplasmataceae archaeon]
MQISPLYGPESKEESYLEKANEIINRLMIKTELQEWNGNYIMEGLPKNEKIRKYLLDFLPEDQVATDDISRVMNSYGKSSIEILRARIGNSKEPVDAVVYPDYETVENLVKNVDSRKYQLVPVGGATCVTGALEPVKGKIRVSINTRNFRRVELKENYILMGSGLTGREAESIANEYGFTLGNFPESFEHSTLGGWVATKAIGQESNQYGGIENLLVGIRMIGSNGYFRDEFVPRNSEGIDVRELAIGSEGRMGLITDVAFKIQKKPERTYFKSYFFKNYEEGIKGLSKMRFHPSIVRLSDEVETSIALDGEFNSMPEKIFEKYLKVRNVRNGSILIIANNSYETDEKPEKATYAGSIPARKWYRERYSRPVLGNILWKRGLIPDTLETSTTWNGLYGIHIAVKQRFAEIMIEEGGHGIIMSHISHIYSAGACIYFSFIIWRKERQMDLLNKVRDGILQEFVRNGCAISHHHGPGKYLEKYLDPNIINIRNRMSDPLFSEV